MATNEQAQAFFGTHRVLAGRRADRFTIATADRLLDVMRHAIALNGSFFNTQRMVLQYVLKAYLE